jgi:hypothetical protein
MEILFRIFSSFVPDKKGKTVDKNSAKPKKAPHDKTNCYKKG